MGKHSIEIVATPYRPTMPTVIRSEAGVLVLDTRRTQFTGYLGQVNAWKRPLEAHDAGLIVGDFDGTEADFLRVIANALDRWSAAAERMMNPDGDVARYEQVAYVAA